MRSLKFPSVIRRQAAARAASGRVTVRRVNSPRIVAVRQNTSTIAASTLSRQLSICSTWSTAYVPRLRQVPVLGIEKLTQMVEFGLAPFRGRGAHHIVSIRGHAGDDRLGIVCPPLGRARLDRVQIGEQVVALTYVLPDVSGRRLFGVLPFVVRPEELPIGGDQIATDARFLVPQSRLQLACRHPCRRNTVVQLARHLVGAIEQHRTDCRTREHQQTHGQQNQELPPAHGELRALQPRQKVGHVAVISRSAAHAARLCHR